MAPRLLGIVLACCAASAALRAQPGPLGQPASLEYHVKAAFLLNFAKFVDWPAGAFTGPDGPLTICVLGQDPFGPILDATIADERIGGLRLAVARPAMADDSHGCHVLFVSASEQERFPEVLARIDRRRTLTVSDVPGFLRNGGHIRLFTEGNRIRFAVNTDNLAGTELRVSSKLLRLAVIERSRTTGAR